MSDNEQKSSTKEFAGGKVDPVEAGRKGGKASGGSSESTSTSNSTSNSGSDSTGGDYKPTEHDGLRKDGQPDGRVKGN